MQTIRTIWAARAALLLPRTIEPLFHRPAGRLQVNSCEYLRRLLAEASHA